MLQATRTALQQGRSVIIDRCNQTPSQRSTFVQLAKDLGAEVHIVALMLPLKLVLARATARTDHEGGVQGPGAARVVHMMNKELQEHAVIDAAAEGARSCTVCTSESQVRAALAVWQGAPAGPLGAWDPAPLVTAAAPAARPAQPTLHSFFGKAGASAPAPTRAGTTTPGAAARAGTTPPGAARVISSSTAAAPPKPQSGTWSTALKQVALHPEAHQDRALRFTQHSVLMLDGYPKARHHALVLARDPALGGPGDLRREHLAILHDMQVCGVVVGARSTCVQGVARAWAAEQGSHTRWWFGFHSIPSMQQLHLHAISTDLMSERIKNKKHWNSFATPFFLHLDDAMQQLEEHGRLTIDHAACSALLSASLRCHRCRAEQPTLPALKRHVASCNALLPGVQVE